ncbi:hypothetical protein BT69DRAFT_334020 [Atractiella rhizophila]|nr:hypothetical protein BT69DRAFT_334020 [Atractiella rhizophila]
MMEVDDANSIISKPLTATQERRLVDYFDKSFLEFSRIFKKRTTSSPADSLSSLLQLSQPIMSLTLSIPPLTSSSASLRSSSLLRLTGEITSSIIEYADLCSSIEKDEAVWKLMRDLDEGWIAVLSAELWDSKERKGVRYEGGTLPVGVSQTDQVRLRNLIVGFKEDLRTFFSLPSTFGPDVPPASSVTETDELHSIDEVVSSSATEMDAETGSDASSESEIAAFRPQATSSRNSDFHVFRSAAEVEEAEERDRAMLVEETDAEEMEMEEVETLSLRVEGCFRKSLEILAASLA